MLPTAFLEEMKQLLGDEYASFVACYDAPAYRGIRLNPLKTNAAALQSALPFPLTGAPFSPYSYYAPEGLRPGSLPAHHAGMFYAQEPSAAIAVTLLDPKPGEWILDLCAAPGGKSTQIAGATGDTGLLVANEIVRERAGILSSNLERMGVKNAVVTSCRPDQLAERMENLFDRVLVDAPCSGEGMFRHDPAAITEWTAAAPAACAARQKEILNSAAKLLRPGGILVYSTCTFSTAENEATMDDFLQQHPEFTPLPVYYPAGRSAWNGHALRIFPMDGGEGHFAALLQKKGSAPTAAQGGSYRLPLPEKSLLSLATALYNDCFSDPLDGSFYHPQNSDTLYIVPSRLPELRGLSVLRVGYAFAKICGNRLEPCHAAFLCRSAADCRQTVDFSPDAPALAAYLRGEEIGIDPAYRGYTAVCCNGIPLGFGKASGGRLKNKYPKGLRNHK